MDAVQQHIYNAGDDQAIIHPRLPVGRMRYKARELTIVQPRIDVDPLQVPFRGL